MGRLFFLGTFIFLFSFSSHSVVGGVNEPALIPPHLCEISPIANQNKALFQYSCSAIIISPKTMKTAGHCGYHYKTQNYSKMLVRCQGAMPFIADITQNNWNFVDPMGPLNPELKVTNSSRVTLDVATIDFDENLNIPHAEPNNLTISEFIRSADQCYFLGTGLDEMGNWGYPQAKLIDKSKIEAQSDETLVVHGPPHVSAHDSGGALFCDKKYVATIVSKMGQDSILSWRDEAPLIEGIPVCPGSQVSDAVKNSVSHFMGFTEIRDIIENSQGSGLKGCLSGLTLEQNASQYFKNLIFLKFTDDFGKVVKQVTLFYQSSSVQGHHSPSGRPWIVIDTRSFNSEVLEKLHSQTITNHINSLIAGFSMARVLEQFPGVKLEEAATHLSTDDLGNQVYLVTWLKDNSTSSSNIYATRHSPKFALVQIRLNGNIEILKQGGSFTPILVPAEKILEEAASKAGSMDEDQVQIFINELSKI